MAAAVDLARETGAHVSGLYVIPAVQVYPSVGFEAAPQVFEGNRTFFKDNAPRVKQAFEEAMRREGLPHDFHLIDARTPVIADEVIATGRSADLVVVSATNPDEITGVERDFVEQVVMSVGPPGDRAALQGRCASSRSKEIVVGWDGGREAARAAFDALPLLKQADKVRIVRIDPQKDPALRGSVAGADLAEITGPPWRQGRGAGLSHRRHGRGPGADALRGGLRGRPHRDGCLWPLAGWPSSSSAAPRASC